MTAFSALLLKCESKFIVLSPESTDTFFSVLGVDNFGNF